MREITVELHSVEKDGLPDMDDNTNTGRIAFILDGSVVSGWPIRPEFCSRPGVWWEPSEDRFGGPVTGVTHWIRLPVPGWSLGGLANTNN